MDQELQKNIDQNFPWYLYAKGTLSHCLRIGRKIEGSYRISNLNAKGVWGLFV